MNLYFSARSRIKKARRTWTVKLISGFALLSCCATPALAQITWQGLHFGTTTADATATLARKNFQITPVPGEGRYTVTPDVHLDLPGVKLRLPLKPELFFSEGKLNMVTLSLDTEELQKMEPKQKGIILVSLFPESVFRQLVARYGTPAFQSGACTGSILADLHTTSQGCSTGWKSNDQFIQLAWFYASTSDRLVMNVQYVMRIEGL